MNCTPETSTQLSKPSKNKPTIQVKQSGTPSAKPVGRKISPQTSPVASEEPHQLTIQVKPPQSQNLPSLNSPHVPQHVPSPIHQPQSPSKPQNNDERITNLLGRVLQIEKNDHKKRAMLLKSVKLFLSQKNPALTQPIISLFLLVFKSVFSTAPPFSVITKSYRHIYFNPRDHPEDVAICYQLFEIINSLQPAYPKELLQCLVRRLSSASVDDRNGAKKCLMSVDEQYTSFLLHHLCLEMIPPPPHGIDSLLELTVELLKSYKSASNHSSENSENLNGLQSLSNQSFSSNSTNSTNSNESNTSTNPNNPNNSTKSNDSNTSTNSNNLKNSTKSNNSNSSDNSNNSAKSNNSNNSNISNNSAKSNNSNISNNSTNSIKSNNSNTSTNSTNSVKSNNSNNSINTQTQKLNSNLESNKISNIKLNTNNSNQKLNPVINKATKLSINSNSHSNLPTVSIPISIPNTNQKTDTNTKTINAKKNPNQKPNPNINLNSKPKSAIINSDAPIKCNPSVKQRADSNKSIKQNKVGQNQSTESIPIIIHLQKSSSSVNLKPNPIVTLKSNNNNNNDTDAIFSNLKHRLELSADDSLFSELQKTFRLLHFAPHFQTFFRPLLTATKALISKNENLAQESRRFLLNYWPRLDPQKAVLFLQEATALCKDGPEIEEFVWQRLSWRASSIQWQIAMEGLNFITQTFERAVNFDHSVLLFLLKDALQHHWNNNVKNKVADVIKLVEGATPKAPKIFPMDKWNLIRSQAESNYPNVDFSGRRRRKK